MRHGARVLVTSSRNQAVDAVTEKVQTFGVRVSPPLVNVPNSSCACGEKQHSSEKRSKTQRKNRMPLPACEYKRTLYFFASAYVQTSKQVRYKIAQYLNVAVDKEIHGFAARPTRWLTTVLRCFDAQVSPQSTYGTCYR